MRRHLAIERRASSRDQLELYECWHSFSFVSGPYSSVSRDFAASRQPGSSGQSGRYSGIDLPPTAPLWEHIVPSSHSPMRRGGGIDLTAFVAGMVLETPALGVKPTPREAMIGR